MRPLGSYGGVAMALRDAALQGPGTVKQLAERAQVGYDTARYTASRLVRDGALAPLNEGRPAVLSAPPLCPAGDALGEHLVVLSRSFWERGPADPDDEDAAG